jgi:hypothetical protein
VSTPRTYSNKVRIYVYRIYYEIELLEALSSMFLP